jgi:hypothetical protein
MALLTLSSTLSTPIKIFSQISFIALCGLLSACGGSDTTIVEKDSIPIEDDHDDEATPATKGRLLIADKDAAKVSIWEIAEQELLEEYTLTAAANALYSSPSYRLGIVMQRTSDKVNVIDSGLFQEDHGDHMDDEIESPMLLSFVTNESRPTHFVKNADQIAIFYDGNAATTTPAKVGVFTETNLMNNTAGNWLNYTTYMHGAAQARGEFLISTIRDSASASTLPDNVGLYKNNAGILEEQSVFSDACPGLHGSAQNTNKILFGCTDGVLVITQNGEEFTSNKILNTADFTGSMRIGTVEMYEDSSDAIGIASGKFFVIDTLANSMTPINWVDSSITPAPSATAYDFADEGELFVILDNQGYITTIDTNNWQVIDRFKVVTSDFTNLATGTRYELALTPGHNAYVSDPINNKIYEVDLDENTATEILQLNFTPLKITWLGIAEPSGHDH